MNKDQVKGRAQTAKGKSKETIGKAIGNKKMQQEGTAEKSVGKIRSAYGDTKQDLKESLT
jgi:uncharacterized protein YjbJ (UPF0337 family)